MFPSNTHEIAKEIAALATSGGGTILLGVTNDGSLCGLADALTASGRDILIRRLEGICRGPVRPAITPSVSFCSENGHSVLVIAVPKGAEPVYYCNGKPYIRHLSESRPAEPHEVIALIRSWLDTQPPQSAGSNSSWIQEVVSACADVIEGHATVRKRMIAPHFERLLAQLRYAAERLRRAAADDEMRERGSDQVLLECADHADRAANFTPRLGMGAAFEKVVASASACASKLYDQLVTDIPVSASEYAAAKQVVRKDAREMRLLAEQALRPESDVRYQDFQDQVSLIGFYILHRTYGGLRSLPLETLEKLRWAAREAYLTDTERLHLDGGRSQLALLQRVNAVSTTLLGITETLP